MSFNLLITLALFLVVGCNGGSGSGASSEAGIGTDNNNPADTVLADPLYIYSWHLENVGQASFSQNSGSVGIDVNLKDVIESGIKGRNVKFAVSDSGIEISHEDLNLNYLGGISKNFLANSPYNGNPVVSNTKPSNHGTSVAGIINAIGWNNKGSRGVAPSGKFGGFNYLASGVLQSIDQTLYQMTGPYDIFNYSYGSTPCGYVPMGENEIEKQSIINQFIAGVTQLRTGKGAVYIKAAGNEFSFYTALPRSDGGCGYSGSWYSQILGNSTFVESNNYPYTIIVGAIEANGYAASYSSPGSNLWISAPGGEYGDEKPAIVTTDLSGCDLGSSNSNSGINEFENGTNKLNKNCSYTSSMNGTSSATPIVSGVVGLMLEANPNLTWRDVKHILASTARISDTYIGAYPHPRSESSLSGHEYMNGWIQNSAGYLFHNFYGFGLVNAKLAVETAKSYNLDLGEFTQTLKPDDSWMYDSGNLNLSIPNNLANGISHSINIKHNFIVESIQVRLSVNHPYVSNLGIELYSPSGEVRTKSILSTINSGIIQANFDDVLLSTNAFYGENSKGDWTLKIIDGSDINPNGTRGSSGVLRNWKINIIGHKPVNPIDSTPPSAITNLSNQAVYSSKTRTPNATFNPSTSSDVLRYEVAVGSNPGSDNVFEWQSIGLQTSFFVSDLSLQEAQQYFISVRVIDDSENISSVLSSGWTVDTVVSPLYDLTNKISYTTSNSTISGPCEPNSKLNISAPSGIIINSSNCSSLGQLLINFSITNTVNMKNYTIAVSQTDLAGNTSDLNNFDVLYLPRDFLSLGDFHGCLIDKYGSAKCWGRNSKGQIGNGTTLDQSSLATVLGLSSGARFISAGSMHTCAVTTTGGAKCWGDNSYGQLGDGTTTDRTSPVNVNGLASGVKQIVTGYSHSCALLNDETVRCWGGNISGSLGDGSFTNSSIPVTVNGLSSVSYVFSNRGEHTCALITNGGLKCWGDNYYGQIGDGTLINRNSPVDVFGLVNNVEYVYTSSYSTCARLLDSSFKCWGYNRHGQLGDGSMLNRITPVDVTVPSNLKDISIGDFGSCAMKNNQAVCWGYNIYNQFNTDSSLVTLPSSFFNSRILSIRVGLSFTCAINELGNLNCRGMRAFGQTGEGTLTYSSSSLVANKFKVKNSDGNAKDISINSDHGCYVSKDNNVFCFGSNDYGEIGDSSSTEGNLVGLSIPFQINSLNGMSSSVTTGLDHSCALTISGGVKCWGRNNFGQLGDGTNTNSFAPVNVSGLSTGVIKVRSGLYHSCALMTDKTIRCWGRNISGQLGNGTTNSSNVPVVVSTLNNADDLEIGNWHSCALNLNRSYCWGSNLYGQLGDGTNIDRTVPVVSSTNADIVLLSVGGWHTCGYTSTNLLQCWGSNLSCELGNNESVCKTNVNIPSTTSVFGISAGVVQLTSGRSHSCALMSNGNTKCWGSNSHGQLGSQTIGFSYNTPVTFSSSTSPNLSLTKLFSGGSSTCGLTTSNDMYCWGDNTRGQRGDGLAGSDSGTSAINTDFF